MWHLRFSLQRGCERKWRPCNLMDTNVSEELVAFILWVKDGSTRFLRNVGIYLKNIHDVTFWNTEIFRNKTLETKADTKTLSIFSFVSSQLRLHVGLHVMLLPILCWESNRTSLYSGSHRQITAPLPKVGTGRIIVSCCSMLLS
jgi:hypothetical protein